MYKLDHGQSKQLHMFGWYFPSDPFVLREMKNVEEWGPSQPHTSSLYIKEYNLKCAWSRGVWMTEGPKTLPSIKEVEISSWGTEDGDIIPIIF